MQSTNPLSPKQMSSDQRIAEVAHLLAKGLLRLREPGSNNTPVLDLEKDVLLAIPARRSVHGQPENAKYQEA